MTPYCSVSSKTVPFDYLIGVSSKPSCELQLAYLTRPVRVGQFIQLGSRL